MSILIKGMEMPDNCTDCWFRKIARHEYLSDCQLCPFTGDTTPYLTRDKKCPLIPVPPHGRLIDADALIIDLMDRGIEGVQTDDLHEIQQAVMDAPTIIPAEEGE